MSTERRTPAQWYEAVLKGLQESGGWMSCYDLCARLTGTPRGAQHGRAIQKIRGFCEQLADDGLADRMESRRMGAPYGKPSVLYRVHSEPGGGL